MDTHKLHVLQCIAFKQGMKCFFFTTRDHRIGEDVMLLSISSIRSNCYEMNTGNGLLLLLVLCMHKTLF